ncbi:MAG: CBS domain-containing protein, partial [Promethearchaeota archaeon]
QNLRIRDIMNTKVITLLPTATAQEAAKLMRENEIGSVIIVENKDQQKPIGIITERDMNNRVVAENKLPSDIMCSSIMSTPVKSISPDILLTEAMHQIAIMHIKRLIVIEKQQMIGIVSQSDILEIAPHMIETLQEVAKIIKNGYKSEFLAGYCEICGNWSDILEEYEEKFICEDCRALKEISDF